MKKAVMWSIVFFTGFAVAFLLTHGSLSAQGSGDYREIISRLDELKGMMNSLKEDIQVIKIRITQMQ